MLFQEKLHQLRHCFGDHNIQAYIVPQTDVHQNEYLPDYACRLTWLTGFSGSAGLSIIAQEQAAIFVDGRYTLQLPQQADMSLFTARKLNMVDIESWLGDVLKAGDVIGFDPWLMTEREHKIYHELCQRHDFILKAVPTNLIDALWIDQPPLPTALAFVHPLEYAGQSIHEKIVILCQQLQTLKADAAIITQLDSIAWLLNIRGQDVAMSPVVLSFAILNHNQTIDLFIDDCKIADDVRAHFGSLVNTYPYTNFSHRLHYYAQEGQRMLVDAARAPYAVFDIIERAAGHCVRADDIGLLPKACKNHIEIAGARQAHIKDGVALVHLLNWLYAAHRANSSLTELDIVQQLKTFRRDQGAVDESFNTIVGSGPHGAIVHYHVNEQTNRTILNNDMVLLDSGGQYHQGTTDVTRTFILGVPTPEQKDRFSRVLKGHIQLAMAKFPKGTSGHQLDALARYALWQVGLDYAHGTGHGVGSFLYVHEGPQRISSAPSSIALQPGMIVSNEPGYYKAGEYGIRMENLVVVDECSLEFGYEQTMLGFETLTQVPIDLKLVDHKLLTTDEKQWLNAYHQGVYEKLAPLIHSSAQVWLRNATQPLET